MTGMLQAAPPRNPRGRRPRPVHDNLGSRPDAAGLPITALPGPPEFLAWLDTRHPRESGQPAERLDNLVWAARRAMRHRYTAAELRNWLAALAATPHYRIAKQRDYIGDRVDDDTWFSAAAAPPPTPYRGMTLIDRIAANEARQEYVTVE